MVFNIDGLGGGFYGRSAWLLFMKTVSSSGLRACMLVHGDTNATLEHGAREYCIGVYGDPEAVENARAAFRNSDHRGLAPFHRRFVEKVVLDQQPLPIKGNVDAAGRLVTDYWNPVDHQLCLETDWGYQPRSVPDDLDAEVAMQLNNLRRPRLPW